MTRQERELIEAARKRYEQSYGFTSGDADLFRRLADALVAAEERCETLEAALKAIEREPMRFHPIAGYQFEIDVRKIAREALAGSPDDPSEGEAA